MSQTTPSGALGAGDGAPRAVVPLPDKAIEYESLPEAGPRGRRPVWVWVLVAIYALLVLAVAAFAVWVPFEGDDGFIKLVWAIAGTLVVCAVGMLFVPVRVASRRPMTRRALWVPVAASAGFAAVLMGGAALAVAEWRRFDDNQIWLALGTVPVVWLVWCVVFGVMSSNRLPQAVATRLHRWVLAGSVLELLVAVPTHVVVRRREECCAGVMTGMGICIGVVVMLLAFGPSVGFLYYRRWQRVRPAGKKVQNADCPG